MGGGASHDQQALNDLSAKLTEFDPVEFCEERLGDCSLPGAFWPLVAKAMGAEGAYRDAYQTIHDASSSLDRVTTALGSVVGSMSDDHGRQEQNTADETGQIDDSED